MPHVRMLRTALLVALVATPVLPSPRPAAGQARTSGWSLAVAGGLGLHGRCDACDADPLGGGFSVTVARHGPDRRGDDASDEPARAWSPGLTWSSVWLPSPLGGLSRHVLGFDLLREGMGRGPGAFVRVGGGVAVSTVVEVDRAPAGPPFGDAVVSIGGTMGLSLSAGAGLRHPLGERLFLAPELRGWVQRVDGDTIVYGALFAALGVR